MNSTEKLMKESITKLIEHENLQKNFEDLRKSHESLQDIVVLMLLRYGTTFEFNRDDLHIFKKLDGELSLEYSPLTDTYILKFEHRNGN